MAVSKNARTSTKGRKLADTGKSGGIITRERIARDLENHGIVFAEKGRLLGDVRGDNHVIMTVGDDRSFFFSH